MELLKKIEELGADNQLQESRLDDQAKKISEL
jgi:hypothetical protein